MGFLKNYYRTLSPYGIGNFRTMEETGETVFLRTYLGKLDHPVVLDVGANRGDYTAAVLEANPSARVVAFEPHPITFAKLNARFALPNVTLQEIGLGDTDETREFFDRAEKNGSPHASLYKDIIETLHHAQSVQHLVRIRRLDDVVRELGIDHIHLLKVDTEGHELAVFAGAAQTLRDGMVDAVQFEFNETNVVARTFFKDFWDLLGEYTIYRLLPDNAIKIVEYIPTFCEVFAFQNIVALRKPLTVWESPIEMSRLG